MCPQCRTSPVNNTTLTGQAEPAGGASAGQANLSAINQSLQILRGQKTQGMNPTTCRRPAVPAATCCRASYRRPLAAIHWSGQGLRIRRIPCGLMVGAADAGWGRLRFALRSPRPPPKFDCCPPQSRPDKGGSRPTLRINSSRVGFFLQTAPFEKPVVYGQDSETPHPTPFASPDALRFQKCLLYERQSL